MALAELAKNITQGGDGCAVCRALAAIPEAEANGLRDLLRNKGLRYTEVSEMIRDDPDTPLDLNANVLGKHARGDCRANEKLR